MFCSWIHSRDFDPGAPTLARVIFQLNVLKPIPCCTLSCATTARGVLQESTRIAHRDYRWKRQCSCNRRGYGLSPESKQLSRHAWTIRDNGQMLWWIILSRLCRNHNWELKHLFFDHPNLQEIEGLLFNHLKSNTRHALNFWIRWFWRDRGASARRAIVSCQNILLARVCGQ